MWPYKDKELLIFFLNLKILFDTIQSSLPSFSLWTCERLDLWKHNELLRKIANVFALKIVLWIVVTASFPLQLCCQNLDLRTLVHIQNSCKLQKVLFVGVLCVIMYNITNLNFKKVNMFTSFLKTNIFMKITPWLKNKNTFQRKTFCKKSYDHLHFCKSPWCLV